MNTTAPPVAEPGWFLPDSAMNGLMRASLAKLVAHAKRARWTNATTRKDGVETTYEADWIKLMVRTDAATTAVSRDIPAMSASSRAFHEGTSQGFCMSDLPYMGGRK